MRSIKELFQKIETPHFFHDLARYLTGIYHGQEYSAGKLDIAKI